MVPVNSENSVPQEEQFGNKNSSENIKKSAEEKKTSTDDVTSGDIVNNNSDSSVDKKEQVIPDEGEKQSPDSTSDNQVSDSTSEPDNPPKEEDSEPAEKAMDSDSTTTDETAAEDASSSEEDATTENEHEKSQHQPTVDKEQSAPEGESNKEEDTQKINKVAEETVEKKIVDFSKLSKKELLEHLKHINNSTDIHDIKSDADNIKNFFYKKHKADNEKLKAKFIADGGNPDDFKPEPDDIELDFKAELANHQQLKAEYNKKLDELKAQNLKQKYAIIEEIEGLINNQESINKTFQEFRDLQKQWREIGIVQQGELKNLWERYNYAIEKFYDFIKINKELRDLDFKKNLENKIMLCERAEALVLESNIVNAFKQLQHYHEQWREIGPVPKENRTELWDRFKEATSKINKKHHEFFENLKKEQKSNLEQKTLLCEKAEEITGKVYDNQKDWEVKSKELIELQGIWKTIGFAPKKHNNKIYQRFREACDTFFKNKRDYYALNKEDQLNNLQIKTELCLQAESLKDSTDWKSTTSDLIKLQKRWKEVGPVPRKNSEEVWQRFRAACDHFFEKKSSYFNNIDSEFDDNLKKKQEIIAKIKSFTPKDDVKESLKALNEFQREWAEIGFVPFKEKERIQEEYREALNKHYDSLDIDEERKKLIKFKSRIDNIASKPRPTMKLKQEREKFVNKLKQLESDITLWENNIGFFAKSNSANEMIHEFEEKIEIGKDRLGILDEKIKLIDDMIDKLNSK